MVQIANGQEIGGGKILARCITVQVRERRQHGGDVVGVDHLIEIEIAPGGRNRHEFAGR